MGGCIDASPRGRILLNLRQMTFFGIQVPNMRNEWFFQPDSTVKMSVDTRGHDALLRTLRLGTRG